MNYSSFLMWRLAIIEIAADSGSGLTDDEEKARRARESEKCC